MNDTLNNNTIVDETVTSGPTPEMEAVSSVEEAPVATTDVPATPGAVPAAGPAAGPADNRGGFSRGGARPARGGFGSRGPGGPGGAPRGRGGPDRRGGPRREPRAKPEFDQKMIDIRRVTRVSAGGRRFSFAVAVVIGDKKGKVGVGTGKGTDTSLAVEKAVRDAKNKLITVPLTKTGSIPHAVSSKYCSARVEMKPALGKGVVAGSSVRDVIVLAGITDINAKLRSGTKNKLNNAQAAIKALASFKKVKRASNEAPKVAVSAN
jgi:small subunit ribosomal protein S5